MTTKTQRDLNLEYWGRVHDMCDAYNKQHGTDIKPYQCVRHCGNMWNLKEHPHFDGSNYDLAVAIIDGKPVFIGDKIYHKAMKHFVTIIEGAFYDCRYWTLTPPKKNRTFELNGQQLPCPSTDDNFPLEIIGELNYFQPTQHTNKV